MKKHSDDVGHYSIEMKTVSSRAFRFQTVILFVHAAAWAHDSFPRHLLQGHPTMPPGPRESLSGSGGLLLAWLNGSLVATLRLRLPVAHVKNRRRSHFTAGSRAIEAIRNKSVSLSVS
jgi:hypothetical protein